MAELLVRVVSKVNPADPFKDVKLTKRGDVIAVQPDGWGWGREELRHPDWRIFRWPSVSVSEASVFLSPELPTEPQLPGAEDPMLQRRGFHIDVDLGSLPKALRDYVGDASRERPYFDVPATVTIAMVKKKRPRRGNPNVIG